MSNDEIRTKLKKSGWKEKLINQALEDVKKEKDEN